MRGGSWRAEVERAGRGRAILVGLAGPIVWLLFVALAFDMGPLAHGRHPIALPVRIPLAIFAMLGGASLPLWRRWVRRTRGWPRSLILASARTAFYLALLALALFLDAWVSTAKADDFERCVTEHFLEARRGLRFALQNVGLLVAILALGLGDLAWIRSLEVPRAEPLRRRPRSVEPIPTARHLRALLGALAWGCAWSLAIAIAWHLLFAARRRSWIVSLEVEPGVLLMLSCGAASVLTWEALRRCGTPRATLGSAIGWGVSAQLVRWMLWLPIAVIVYLATQEEPVLPDPALLPVIGWPFLMFEIVGGLVVQPLRVFAFLALLLLLGAMEMVFFRRCFRARDPHRPSSA
ncbi:MAG: hypothetical protein IPN34_02525 [Planctomycetes bacterium]|nr:hypothetical protein [Planctomycetota bacterium]